jgi:hypothetical protein
MAPTVIRDYDRRGDVLNLCVGSIQRTVNVPVDEDLTMRLHPGTGKVIGLTVTNCRLAHPELLRRRVPVEQLLRWVMDVAPKLSARPWPAPQAGQEKAQEALPRHSGSSLLPSP